MLPRQLTPDRVSSMAVGRTSHLLTWLLAGCGLVVIATNLFVNIRITADYGASASATETWARRLADWDELARRAVAVQSSAIRNVQHRDSDQADSDITSARQRYDTHAQHVRQSLIDELPAEVSAALIVQLDCVDLHAQHLEQTARQTIAIPPSDAQALALGLVRLNANLDDIQSAVHELHARGRQAWQREQEAQFSAAQSAARWGGGVTLVIVLSFASSVWLVRWSTRTTEEAGQTSQALAQQIRKQQSRLNEFVDEAPVGAHSLESSGRILWANEFELNLLGYTAERYVGRAWSEFHDDPAVVRQLLEQLRAGESVQDLPLRLRHRNGEIRHVLLNSTPVMVAGVFVQTRCFLRDVTRQVAAETARQTGEQRFQSLADQAALGIFRADRFGGLLSANQAALKIAGAASLEKFNRGWLELLHPEDRGRVAARWRAAIAGGTEFRDEYRFLHADGRCVPVMSIVVPLRNDAGQVTEYIGTLSELHAQHGTEDQILDKADQVSRAA